MMTIFISLVPSETKQRKPFDYYDRWPFSLGKIDVLFSWHRVTYIFAFDLTCKEVVAERYEMLKALISRVFSVFSGH